MFTSLRTGTKLILLCTLFIICVAVTTYSLVVEKQIAIAFARKELSGSKFLAALRPGLFCSPNRQTVQSVRSGAGHFCAKHVGELNNRAGRCGCDFADRFAH